MIKDYLEVIFYDIKEYISESCKYIKLASFHPYRIAIFSLLISLLQ